MVDITKIMQQYLPLQLVTIMLEYSEFTKLTCQTCFILQYVHSSSGGSCTFCKNSSFFNFNKQKKKSYTDLQQQKKVPIKKTQKRKKLFN